jgi:hypothetical protein
VAGFGCGAEYLAPEPRMDAHENRRTTPHGRMLGVERLGAGWTIAAATALGNRPAQVAQMA